MSIRKSVEQLAVKLLELTRVLKELDIHIADAPAESAMLVDTFQDAAQDVLGAITEARIAAGQGVGARDAPLNPDVVRDALGTAHELVLQADERLHSLLAYDRVAELLEFGTRRGGGFRVWSRSVHHALEACRAPLHEVHHALLECWQELAERYGAGGVAVQTTNIGQQVSLPLEPAEALG